MPVSHDASDGSASPAVASDPWPTDVAVKDGADLSAAASLLKRVLVRKADRWVVVALVDVDWIGGAGNYVQLHVGPHSHLYRQTLKSLEPQLDPDQFVRIHRSTIVNVDRISEMRLNASGCYDMALRDGSQLRVSRRHRECIRALVGRI